MIVSVFTTGNSFDLWHILYLYRDVWNQLFAAITEL